MSFSREKAQEIANQVCNNDDERSLIPSFVEVCSFLSEFPDELSWKTKKDNPIQPSVDNDDGLNALANKYFEGLPYLCTTVKFIVCK